MKENVKWVVLLFVILISVFLVYLFQSKPRIEIAKDEYYEAKSVIYNYFDKLLSKNYHQLELGATDIFFDEKIIKEIKLLKISANPIIGRANTKTLLDKYDTLEKVLVFEITYDVKYQKKFRHLFQVTDGEINQFITLIKLKNSNMMWLIEEIGY
ncbi:MAG: hypothetical protein BGO41_08345 [Clostridiales bacterium 38-18]|nr:MAG: hypothetical protein BGO41_08345 [Clostridiales bacterium 38-18]